MRKLHEDMSERHRWYARWHAVPYVTLLHFLILCGVAYYTATSLDTRIADEITIEEVLVAAVGGGKPEASVGQLTKKVLETAKAYQFAVTPEAQASLLEELTQLVGERRDALVALAKADPDKFLLATLPPGIQKQLPPSIQPLLEQEVDVEGEVTVIHRDARPEANDKEETIYDLDTNSGNRYHLRYGKDKAPLGLTTGSRVKVHGVSVEDELVPTTAAAGGGSGTTVTSTATAGVTGPRKAIVMLVNFTDSTSQPWTKEQVASLFFTASNSSSLFYQDNSFGQLALTGDVVGWLTLPMSYANCNSNYYTVASAADQAAVASGVNLSNYQHKVYFYNSNAGCSWGGQGTVGGNPSQAWIYGYYEASLNSHELGHNLSAHHAQSLYCGSKQIDAYANCSVDEYGDHSSVMGNSYSYYPQFNGPHKVGEGWLPASTHLQTVTSSGTYTITPTELSGSSIKILKIPKPNTGDAYYFSYRQPLGFDSRLPAGLTSGASIHIWNGSVSSQTKMVDASPDGDFHNAALIDGQSFTDSVNGITVTQVSHSADSVTLNVQLSGAQCVPSAPTFTMSPVSQGAAGTPLTYNLSLRNNDSSTCGNGTFTFGSTIPSGWGSSFSPASLTLSPGGQGSASVTVTPATGTADGTYTFTMRATESSVSVHTASAQASYVVYTPLPDSTLPTVTITSPANGAKLKANGNTNISVSASDAGGIATITISTDGALRKTCTNATSCSFSWSNRSISTGSHLISAVATDKAGNSNSASVTVTR